MSITKAWKVYGADGHRQRESFHSSARINRSGNGEICIVEVRNADWTGTHDYSIIKITADTADRCEQEFTAQLTDGVFENCRVGRYEEIGSVENWYCLDTNFFDKWGDWDRSMWAFMQGRVVDGQKDRKTAVALFVKNYLDTGCMVQEINRVIESELGFVPDYEII